MDVSNSTGQDTQYRVANGGTKAQANTWQPLPQQSRRQCCELTAPFTIEFMLADGTLVSHTFHHPKAIIELVEDGKNYKIKAHNRAA
jgi:hypothetical protein